MQATKAYRGLEIQLHTFLTVVWTDYRPSTLKEGKEPLVSLEWEFGSVRGLRTF